MQMACTFACEIISSMLVKAATPYFAAKTPAFSGERAHTATNSDSGKDRSAAACRWPAFPQPTRAVLILLMRCSRLDDYLHQSLFAGIETFKPGGAVFER